MGGAKNLRNSEISSMLLAMIISLLLLLMSGTAKSEVYTVGDGDEWSSGTNYLAWSKKYNFTLGDILVFKYAKDQHNAYEVTESTYQSCDPSSGVLAKYESGNDQVELNEAKKYWFICNVKGHCFGGMRFSITVNDQANGNAIANNNTATTTTSPPHQRYSCSSSKRMGLLSYIILGFGVSFIALIS